MRKKAKAKASGTDAPETTPAAVPTPSAPEGTQDAPRSAKDVGRQLRALRRERGLSRADVARSAGLTKRELAAYESGRTEVPDHDLFCLAGSCGVDVDDLLPGRDDLRVGPSGSSLSIGDRTQSTGGPGSDDVLRTFAEMINELRVLVPGAPAPWRAEDMAALAQALGGTPASIEARLIEVTGASREEAAQMRAVLVPAAGVTDSFSLGALDPGDRAAEFFAGPRAADPFAPPPPLTAEVVAMPAPEPVHAMAGAPARPDPFGFAPEPASASHVISETVMPLAPPAMYVPTPGDGSVPAYWGIGGEEIFLWGDQAASAVHASVAAPFMPVATSLDALVDPVVEAPVEAPLQAPVQAPFEASVEAPPAAWVPEPEPAIATPEPPAPVPDVPVAAPAATEAPAAPETVDVAWQVGGTIEGPSGDPAAATRWALSDLRVPGDSTIEAVLDFAAGTGFGVLFRAAVDGHDRMSGYSFDVDPLGGAYVVRQWVDNLPHWQTLAQTPSSPTRQYGRHQMVITLTGDAMAASVDGVPVMAIPSLGQASVATGCEPARGHRVGLQATPTADVTVESFRATPA